MRKGLAEGAHVEREQHVAAQPGEEGQGLGGGGVQLESGRKRKRFTVGPVVTRMGNEGVRAAGGC